MLRIVILAVALLAGGGAAWLAYSTLGADPAPTPADAAEPLPTRDVLVATAPIARGRELGPANLGWSTWPESAAGEGLVLQQNQPDAIESYTGWVSRTDLLPGEPVRPERLVEGSGGLMSLMLTPGMRAVAVRISAESGAGGFIMPNDRVDIIHTVMRDSDGDGADEPVSDTIIRNVRVLAVDQMAVEDEAGTARVAETATLELTPEQVELLSTARSSGQLSLALRAVADFGGTESGNVAHLAPGPALDRVAMASAEEASQPPEREDPPERAPRIPVEVRIIRSGQIETVQLDGREP